MILSVLAVLKDIYEQGRNFVWPRPEVCPHCGAGKPWGHGFVPAYFDGFDGCVFLRRYRCSQCGCVMRLKPEGYFRGFQAPMETIRSAIREGPEQEDTPSRSRRGHWLRALKRKAAAYLGAAFSGSPLQAFDRLVTMGTIPVSRSI